MWCSPLQGPALWAVASGGVAGEGAAEVRAGGLDELPNGFHVDRGFRDRFGAPVALVQAAGREKPRPRRQGQVSAVPQKRLTMPTTTTLKTWG